MTIATVIDRLPQLHNLATDSGAVQELSPGGRGHRRRGGAPAPARRAAQSIATIIYTSDTTGRPRLRHLARQLHGRGEHGHRAHGTDLHLQARQPGVHTAVSCSPAPRLGRMVQVAGVLGKVKLGHQPQMHAAVLLPDLAAPPATFHPGGAVHLREGLQRGPPQGREGREVRKPSRRPWRSRSATRTRSRRRRGGSAPGRSASCGCSTSSSTRSSTPRCAPPWAAGSDTRCRAAPAMDRRLGCSSPARASRSTRDTGSPRPPPPPSSPRPSGPGTGRSARRLPGTTVHIADDGEIWLHGDNIFQGYLNYLEGHRRRTARRLARHRRPRHPR